MIDVLHNFWFLVAVTVIVCSVTATIAQAWQKVRRAEQETALKQEMLRRGLTVEEMERLLRVPAKAQEAPCTDDEAIENLVASLCQYEVSTPVTEQILVTVRAADPSIKQAVCRAVQAVLVNSSLEGNPRDEQVLAVVRGLRPRDRPSPVEEAPPASPAKVEETFQPVRPV